LARGAGSVSYRKWQKILISKERHGWKRGEKISILHLKLGGNQSLVQDKEDVLTH
jgi:hypothetical protein